VIIFILRNDVSTGDKDDISLARKTRCLPCEHEFCLTVDGHGEDVEANDQDNENRDPCSYIDTTVVPIANH